MMLSGWTEVENPYEKVQNTGFVWDLWSLWRENLEEEKKKRPELAVTVWRHCERNGRISCLRRKGGKDRNKIDS